MCKIGEHCVVDPSSDEEHCSTAALVVAVSQGRFTTVLQSAPGAFISTTLLECLKIAQEVATNLDNSLTKILAEAPLQKDVGFLS